jgi:hypothetical protein
MISRAIAINRSTRFANAPNLSFRGESAISETYNSLTTLPASVRWKNFPVFCSNLLS